LGSWYGRPVLFVGDLRASIDFYVGKLGFNQSWLHEEGGLPLVAQIERQGCALILSCQWPKKTGHGMIFVSLDRADFEAMRTELASNRVPAREDHWGYRVVIVTDADGNELYFPFPGEATG
jgi:catechol 2,3-dioxygenase-like lactoylglutathione lyase family enzyme